MGAVPSSYYEMNVDQVVLEEEAREAREIQVNTIGEELPKDEASLGVIDLSSAWAEVKPVDADDDLSQKQKQQKYNYWFWWRK